MERPQHGAASVPGDSFRTLYRIAGASFMLAGVLYVWAFVAELLLPVRGATTVAALLESIASYRSYYVASYALFTVANSLSIVGVFGIYAATRVANMSYATLGAGTMTIGLVTTLLSSTAPALIRLSDGYSSSSASAADQQAFATAALAVSATNNPLIASAFIGVGVIFVSLAMAGPFGKGLAYLGLVVGVLNIVRALPFLAGYPLLTGVVFVSVSSVWIVGVGRRVYKEAGSMPGHISSSTDVRRDFSSPHVHGVPGRGQLRPWLTL